MPTRTERRANLIFGVALAVLTLPGASILAYKKLSQEKGRPTFPPPVRHQFAFMDPTPGVARADARFVPPLTGAWVASTTHHLLTFDEKLTSHVPTATAAPIMSRKRDVQLVASDVAGGHRSALLFVWNRHARPLVGQYEITARVGDATVPGRIDGYKTELLPLDARSELRNAGVIHAPSQIVWMLVRFDGATGPVESIHVRYTGDVGFEDEVKIEEPTTVPTRSDALGPSRLSG